MQMNFSIPEIQDMTKNYFISIYLDTRRPKQNGKYPVKLRVFTKLPRKQKLYNTDFEFTKSEFESIWETKKPRNEHKDNRLELAALEKRASDIADGLPQFSFENFERLMYGISGSGQIDVVSYYNQAIAQYKRNKQMSTASNYELSLKSLIDFHKKDNLSFYDINPQWLKDYEEYMIELKERSRTTVGIYLRPLRAIFNTAIADKIVSVEQYPFGRRKYTIPAPKGTKKALSKEQLRALFEVKPATPEQKKAKAFWFFSYACNGMNFKDIANLKYKDISGDTLTFRRAKTSRTNAKQAPVIVYLNDFIRSVIKLYGNPENSPHEYIFPITDPNASPGDRHNQLKNFIRFVNQHIAKLSKIAGIKEQISTYWARHSFATNAIRNGASMEFVSEALSHSNLNTTRNYFAGFEDEKKREIAQQLMVF